MTRVAHRRRLLTVSSGISRGQTVWNRWNSNSPTSPQKRWWWMLGMRKTEIRQWWRRWISLLMIRQWKENMMTVTWVLWSSSCVQSLMSSPGLSSVFLVWLISCSLRQNAAWSWSGRWWIVIKLSMMCGSLKRKRWISSRTSTVPWTLLVQMRARATVALRPKTVMRATVGMRPTPPMTAVLLVLQTLHLRWSMKQDPSGWDWHWRSRRKWRRIVQRCRTH